MRFDRLFARLRFFLGPSTLDRTGNSSRTTFCCLPPAMLELNRNPILNPKLTPEGVEAELKSMPHPTRDRRLQVGGVRRHCRDARKSRFAAETIGKLPGPDEAVHLVIGGRYALWHVVPAVATLTRRRIDRLHIATLGFSKENVAELCAMIDAGKVGAAWLLCSHYFKGTSGPIYQFAEEELNRRPDRASFLSVRTHAKLLLMQLADGRTLTVESSANLRSCKNVEQMTLIGSPEVYQFHVEWIEELFAQAKGAR